MLAILGGVLVLVVGAGVVVGYRLGVFATVESASPATPLPAASRLVGPVGETFDLPVGEPVAVELGRRLWVVTLRSIEWFDGGCDPSAGIDVPVLVAELAFTVQAGTASLSPVFDFSYIDADGHRMVPTGRTGCDDPRLTSTFSVEAGITRTGKIAFIVPSGRAGELFYRREIRRLTGSWLIPALAPR